MLCLKQSTAVTIKLGPFVDESDGKTPETALTITQADVRLAKGGGDFAQKNDATTCTHDENGWYNCSLDATDTGTLGRLVVAVNVSGALPVWHEFEVLPASVYDALVSGTSALDAGSGSYTVTRVYKDGDGNAVTSLKVTCKNADESLVIATQTTDSSGSVTFNLDAGTYHLVTPSTSVYEASNTEIVVSDNSTDTITISTQTPSVPSDPQYCRVYCWVKEEDGTIPTGTFEVERIHSPRVSGSGSTAITVVLGDNPGTLDANGYAYVDVLRGAKVDLALYTNGKEFPDEIKRRVTIPDTASANWETL